MDNNKDNNKDTVKQNSQDDLLQEQNSQEDLLQEQDLSNSNQDNIQEIGQDNDLQAKLQIAENTSKEYLDRLQRTMAEFDNFRKRTNVEKASMYENGVISMIEKLLPIYDNFERAITSTPDEDKNSNVFKGLEMIYKQFNDLFTSLNIQEVEGQGQPFDPNIHNAVLHIEDENLEQNVVAEVLQKGYKYNDKVIRPSMVKVAN